MKPLTIEELKALEVGDWVWIVDRQANTNMYGKFTHSSSYFEKFAFYFETAGYSMQLFEEDYSTKWQAYKNKEHAECKGQIVEFPCIREVYKKNKPTYRVFFLRDDNFIDSYAEWTEEEAERRLAELKGEKV